MRSLAHTGVAVRAALSLVFVDNHGAIRHWTHRRGVIEAGAELKANFVKVPLFIDSIIDGFGWRVVEADVPQPACGCRRWRFRLFRYAACRPAIGLRAKRASKWSSTGRESA
jgi:hypothetical protein